MSAIFEDFSYGKCLTTGVKKLLTVNLGLDFD